MAERLLHRPFELLLADQHREDENIGQLIE
jgi:hypothetical protein